MRFALLAADAESRGTCLCRSLDYRVRFISNVGRTVFSS